MMLAAFVLSFTLFGPGLFQDGPLELSCATFHPFLSERELITKYGRENVTNGPIFGSDDGPSEGTILFANRDDMRVEILWKDTATRQNPLWIRVRGDRSRWRTLNGLALDDDLRTIEQRNGFPFRLAGFTSEGHGDLVSWGNGRLANTPNCNVVITFQPRTAASENLSIRQVTSLAQVSSGHPAMQKVNPSVVSLWIRYPFPQSSANAGDALLDVLVFGLHMSIDPAQYSGELRTEIQRYLRRAVAYNPKRAPPPSSEAGMVYSAQVSYETRLAAISDDPSASDLAQTYVAQLRPCYEWEGFHGCPEHDAKFADEYQAAHPTGPFRYYLPLLAAHRWLCTAEAYDYEKNTKDSERSRRLYEQRVSVAQQSQNILIRVSADRLAARGQCLPK